MRGYVRSRIGQNPGKKIKKKSKKLKKAPLKKEIPENETNDFDVSDFVNEFLDLLKPFSTRFDSREEFADGLNEEGKALGKAANIHFLNVFDGQNDFVDDDFEVLYAFRQVSHVPPPLSWIPSRNPLRKSVAMSWSLQVAGRTISARQKTVMSLTFTIP